MKQILYIIIPVLLSLILSHYAAQITSSTLNKYDKHDYNRFTEIFYHNTDYDILFIGSSRTHRSIYPKIVDSICAANSFNAGTTAGGISDFKMILEGYLVNHPAPKVLVLTLDLNSFMDPKTIFNYPQYYPYLKNKKVESTLTEYGYKANLIRLFPFIRITDLDDYMKENAFRAILGKVDSNLPKGDFEYKGYLSNGDDDLIKSKLDKVNKPVHIDSDCVFSLNQIIDICKRNKIKLIFTYAPEYDFYLRRSRANADSVFNFITRTAIINNIPYLRDDSLELCKNPSLFADIAHLNKLGAMKYSPIIAQEIKNVLLRSKDTIH